MVFGRLTVLYRAKRPPEYKNRSVFWHCRCVCGNEVALPSERLQHGKTRSCGCVRQEFYRRGHGHAVRGARSDTYQSWACMRTRCLNPNANDYPDYGGKGITVCERWDSFENFLADMGERPEGMTIDRKDGRGHYEPDNCRWATAHEQRVNRVGREAA